MQVYGELITLPEQGQALPLPWHCRAPLGLQTNVPVHVALVYPGTGGTSPAAASTSLRPPDLIASPLDPHLWPLTYKLTLRGPDRPGLLLALLSAIYQQNLEVPNRQLNVALGESVTVTKPSPKGGTGPFHESVVFCEPAWAVAHNDVALLSSETVSTT